MKTSKRERNHHDKKILVFSFAFFTRGVVVV